MKLAGSEKMRELDTRAIEAHGIPSSHLMSNAASHISGEITKYIPKGGSVSVFCGVGNNGGDGLCAAAMLIERGYTVRIFLIGNSEKMTADTSEMVSGLKRVGGALESFDNGIDTADFVNSCDVILDAMLGIGLNKPLYGDFQSAVELINNSPAYTVSADIPTGVSADTGLILGCAVKADLTVTFTLPKIGQFIEPGCVYCGEVKIFDIGIPRQLVEELETDSFAVMPGDVTLPRRSPDTHKGDYGRAFIVGGSIGYTGAPIMASDAALRMGAGLVYLGVPDSIYSIAAIKCTEVMPLPLPCDEDGIVAWNAREPIYDMLDKCDVCLIGPGLGASYQLDSLIENIVQKSQCPLILDADGINAAAKNIDVLKTASAPLVLTPHPGEFARLGGNLELGRLNAARDFAVEHKCVLILKGHRTITALPDGKTFVNTTGGPAMAKGGSGDVLGGMVAALIGQKLPTDKACVTAVYLHGLAGDICAEKLGEYSVTASDIIGEISGAVKTIMR